VSFIRSKYIGTRIISTPKRAINRLPTSSKAVSSPGLLNMVTMKISLTKIDFLCYFGGMMSSSGHNRRRKSMYEYNEQTQQYDKKK
jgi:hypothetical protein